MIMMKSIDESLSFQNRITGVNQDALRENLVPEERRRFIQDDQIDPIGLKGAHEAACEMSFVAIRMVLPLNLFLINRHRDINIAQGRRPALGRRSEKVSKRDFLLLFTERNEFLFERFEVGDHDRQSLDERPHFVNWTEKEATKVGKAG